MQRRTFFATAGAASLWAAADRGPLAIGSRRALFADLTGDRIARQVTLAGGDVASIASQPVRLRWRMKDAEVFSLRFRD